MSPGSYLLSRDLSSDYHRRADVSLPGSEWGRVEPSGCDHQAAKGMGEEVVGFLLFFSFVCLVFVLLFCVCGGC